jgi:hypothetical protein
MTEQNKNTKTTDLSTKQPLFIDGVSGSYFDSEDNELKEGDVFEYTSKKWKQKKRIIERGGKLGTMVYARDTPDRFIPLEKFLRRHYVIKVE